jgi:hypothetical protein
LFLVHCSWFIVLGSLFLVHCSWFIVLGSLLQLEDCGVEIIWPGIHAD